MGKSTANHTAMTLWSRAWKVMLKKKKSIWTWTARRWGIRCLPKSGSTWFWSILSDCLKSFCCSILVQYDSSLKEKAAGETWKMWQNPTPFTRKEECTHSARTDAHCPMSTYLHLPIIFTIIGWFRNSLVIWLGVLSFLSILTNLVPKAGRQAALAAHERPSRQCFRAIVLTGPRGIVKVEVLSQMV